MGIQLGVPQMLPAFEFADIQPMGEDVRLILKLKKS